MVYGMPGQEDLPTVVTVTWNTWETYTSRLLDSFFHYVSPDQYAQWIMVDSDSEDREKIAAAMVHFPEGHREKFTLVGANLNVSDLPQYNRVIPKYVQTEKVICISTDVRIWDNTVPFFTNFLDDYDMVGVQGPTLPRSAADEKLGGSWHWVPALLIARNLEFDSTLHIQTHCFGVKRSAFVEVGGFWEPGDERYLDKGNLITGEIYFSVKLLKAGYRLYSCFPPCYHYGNAATTREQIDAYDRSRGWNIPFSKGG